jgi:hypothetical protein
MHDALVPPVLQLRYGAFDVLLNQRDSSRSEESPTAFSAARPLPEAEGELAEGRPLCRCARERRWHEIIVESRTGFARFRSARPGIVPSRAESPRQRIDGDRRRRSAVSHAQLREDLLEMLVSRAGAARAWASNDTSNSSISDFNKVTKCRGGALRRSSRPADAV